MKKPAEKLREDKLAEYINKYVVPQTTQVRKMILKTQKNKLGECKVYIEVRRYRYLTSSGKKFENKQKRIPTDVWVLPNNWSVKKQEVLKGDFDFQKKNTTINKKYSDIKSYINSDSLDYKFAQLDKSELLKIEELFPSKKMLLGRYLTDYLDEYIKIRKGYSARGTWKEYITLKNRILNYELSIGSKLVFTDIDFTFSTKFHSWLHKSYSNGTIYKTYELLVTFMYHYWRIKDERNLDMNDKFTQRGFKRGNPESNEPNPLTESEYKRLLKKKFNNETLNKARLRFLLQCTLGARYVDIFTFTPKMFRDGILTYKPQKTKHKSDNVIHLPLSNDAKMVLQECNYDTTSLKISNQKYNEGLEQMFENLKWEKRTSHNGRDTFITRAINAGVNVSTILEWVGQESYEQLKKYFKYTQVQGKKEMRKLNK